MMKTSLYIVVFLAFALICKAQENKAFLSIYDKYWEIEKGYYRVMQDGEVGLVDSSGGIIIPCENDQVWNLQDNGNIKVLKDGKLGIYNINGDIIVPAIYDMIWDYKDGMAKVIRNSMIGYINTEGNEVIPCKYQQVWDFKNGKAKVLREGKFGMIDREGFEFIPAKYQKIWDFKDGKAIVLRSGKMGMIDESGSEFVAPAYQKIWDFEKGKAKVLKNGKMGYINEDGEEIIPCIYDHLDNWEDGKVKAINNGQIFYIDEDGELLEGQDITMNQATDSTNTPDTDKTIYKSNDFEHSKDTSYIRLLGMDMEIIKNKESTEVSFDNNQWDNNKNKESHIKCNRRKNKTRFHGHYFGVDLGFNNYLNSDYEMSMPDGYDYLSLNSAKSIEVAVNLLQQDIHLGSTVGFYTGLGFDFNNYRYDQPIVPIKDENDNLSYETFDYDVRKSKLTTLYLTVPIMFELQFSKRRNDAFYMAVGGVGGYRIASHTKVVTSEDGKKVKDKDHGDFCLNDFRYGAQLRFGFKSINLYGTYYFSSLFDTDSGPELHPVSIGFSLYPDWW